MRTYEIHDTQAQIYPLHACHACTTLYLERRTAAHASPIRVNMPCDLRYETICDRKGA